MRAADASLQASSVLSRPGNVATEAWRAEQLLPELAMHKHARPFHNKPGHHSSLGKSGTDWPAGACQSPSPWGRGTGVEGRCVLTTWPTRLDTEEETKAHTEELSATVLFGPHQEF